MVELFTLLTAADYEDMKSYGAYTFFRVGIAQGRALALLHRRRLTPIPPACGAPSRAHSRPEMPHAAMTARIDVRIPSRFQTRVGEPQRAKHQRDRARYRRAVQPEGNDQRDGERAR